METSCPQTPTEEFANTISHGLGFLATLAAAPILIIAAVDRGDAAGIVAASLFAATLVMLYCVSTLYHALSRTRARRVFRILDHSAIFLLIAGTYTPFTLGVLKGGWGWTLFGIVWGLATVGVVLKATAGFRFPLLSTLVYLGMGWLVVVAIHPLWQKLPFWGLFWLVAGGLAYTLGIPFFAAKKLRYSHCVWHLFVILGSFCHFIAVLRYSA